MANVTITIADGDVVAVLDSICAEYGYSGGPTQAEKVAFAKQQLIDWIVSAHVRHSKKVAAQAAGSAAGTIAQGISVT